MDDLVERAAMNDLGALERQRYVGAHHEAAHTIARLVLDAPFHEVVLDADGLGVSRGYPEGEAGPWTSLWTRGCVSMAGPAVEAYFLSILFAPSTNAELFKRWRSIQLFAEEEMEEDPTSSEGYSDEALAGAFAGGGFVFARVLLDAHWAEIKILAAELLAKGVVGHEEISTLLPDFSPDAELLSREADEAGASLVRESALYYYGR